MISIHFRNNLGEKELARKAGGGDSRCQRELYERYAPYLTAVVSRYIPDRDMMKDVLQEAFISIFSNLGSFSYRGEGSLRAWMSKIAVNGALKSLRSAGRAVKLGELPDDLPDEEPDVDSVPMEVLQGFIKQLPDGYRTVFNLYVFEQKSHKEIAELLGIKENSSASQLLRARAALSKAIKEYKKHE